ncbi:MAG: MFS transporter [Nibricoccus sp.]
MKSKSSNRVSWRERIGFGLGKVAVDGSHGTLHVLVNPIYNMTLGLNPALISTVVFIQRIWDAMLDPIWGNFSDSFRSRWGRRRPFLLVAAMPLAIFFAAIWWFPAGASGNWLFWHLLLVSLAFYTAHSLYAMPLAGLTVEATDDYHERTRLAATVLVFSFAAQIVSQWIFPLTQLKVFSNNITGLRWTTSACAILLAVFGLLPALLCRERAYERAAQSKSKSSLLQNLRVVRGNHSFLALLSARFVASFGYNIVGMLGIYMNTYYVFNGSIQAAALFYAILGTAFQISAIGMSVFIYPTISRRFGKKRALQIAATILIVGCSCKLVVYQPGHPWLQLIVFCANGAAQAGFFLLPSAMLGDIADQDELKTGLRREALFASLLYWFEKAGNSLGSFLAGFVLIWIGFNAKLGPQTASTLHLMKFSYFFVPTIGAITSLILIKHYTLTEKEAYEIKEKLARGNPL